jgi:SAM-dependent methyltransferase
LSANVNSLRRIDPFATNGAVLPAFAPAAGSTVVNEWSAISAQGRFYDHILKMLDDDHVEDALHLLAGALNALHFTRIGWPASRQTLRDHPLHDHLMRDPYVARAFHRPRGYPGDAELIDFIYDRTPPPGTDPVGARLFAVTTDFPVARAIRQRMEIARQLLTEATAGGARICSLACGHLREADGLRSAALSNVTAVDQDGLSLARIKRAHGDTVNLVDRNVLGFLRDAASRGETFDLIYTLGLTDYLDDRSLALLLKLAQRCLAPGGRIFIANLQPQHLAAGWIDACMDWHLIYRSEAQLTAFAAEQGMASETFSDALGTVAYCTTRN